MQKEDLKVLVDQTQLQRLGKEFCLVRMANQAKGQAGDCAVLASGKLCSTLQKQFSICVIFIWNKFWIFIANIEQLPMPSKLCWLQNQTCSCWPCSGQDFAVLLRHFFCDFKSQLLMRDVHPSTNKCRALNSRKVLSDDWSCFVWMRLYKLQPGL